MGLADTGEASAAPARRTRMIDMAGGDVETPEGPTLLVAVGGLLTIDGIGDAKGTKTQLTVVDGASIPIRVARIYQTGTDADGIVAIW